MARLSLPIAFRRAIGGFAPVFSRPVWQRVTVLMPGAVLAPGQRTVPAMLQIMGRRAAADFQPYHRGLHRAGWSPLPASRRRLQRFVAGCLPLGAVAGGLDDPMARRRGEPRQAKGSDREPMRSSHASLVKVRGLRWRACRLLVPPLRG